MLPKKNRAFHYKKLDIGIKDWNCTMGKGANFIGSYLIFKKLYSKNKVKGCQLARCNNHFFKIWKCNHPIINTVKLARVCKECYDELIYLKTLRKNYKKDIARKEVSIN